MELMKKRLANLLSDKTADYGAVQEAMGKICLVMGDVQQGTTHLKKALAIYETVFEAEPELIEEKKQDILETYAQAGVYLGNAPPQIRSPADSIVANHVIIGRPGLYAKEETRSKGLKI